MNARHAYKIIKWYDVYQGEILSDDEEDRSIYLSLLETLKDCHDIIEDNTITYHQFYECRIFDEEYQQYNY